ncbi:Arginine/ornithine antiporter [Corynebacterium afermentans subsp. afermentans]|uniref:Lysine:proton symporter, APA family n=1 Tax=Corynebacterium afermentans TaxID=38286 RepID=A0A9X8R496_9CORY|nr:amino acid permease [Corynebacterium afermentans]MCG7291897.1 amino acid permease [Corynebacterium afermentans]MDC7109298.1 amino acid permease [Corynebacterium afermentans]OAA16116.1 lysine transporter [Corynebacterium afermentans subsp. afermentans]WJY55725.1 Arginine/ornithine antiporter [Corynebacterium afermentans subsp. afermentans]SIQ32630.1 lysine:proton symporter, APA family [Corynebacterium afermentans]
MSKRTVSVWTLVSLIIGSTIGSGIFALPQNIGSVASPGAMLTGWAIAGVGMLSIAFVFQILAVRKPHLDSGVYSYVRAGLGDFIGFTSGMGYWLGSVMAQVGYATLFFNTLGYYFPAFSNRWVLALSVSAMSWLIFYGLTRGLRQAAVMNAVTTVAKLLPILAFIVLVAFLGFSWDRFTMDFWGSHIPFTDQLKGIMLYTVWVFIGIEGASVYSKQARVRSDVGKATIIGFLSVLGLLVAVSTLSYGVLSQEELAALPDNSMGAVLEQVVGPWGGALISIGLCLSVLGAYVSWQMLCAEPIVLMALDGLLPRSMGSHNSNGSPVRAQLLSTLAIQFFVVVFFLSSASYNAMVQLATIMYLLPYIFSSIYLVLLTIRGKGLTHPHAGTRFDDSGPEVSRRDNRRHLIVGLIGSVYSLWLIYAADPVYVLLGALAVVPGLVPYIWTRRKHGDTLFNAFEKVVVAVVLVAAVIAVVGLVNGSLVLE